MELAERKVNDIIIKKVPGVRLNTKSKDKLFGDLFPVVYLLAKRKTGKTTTLYTILDHCADPKDTIVIFFCGQITRDPTYKSILKRLQKRNIKYIPCDSMYGENGEDELANLIEKLKQPDDDWAALDPFAPGNEEADDPEPVMPKLYKPDGEEDSDGEPVEEIPFRYIIVIDDLSDEIKHSRSLKKFLKESRHMRCMTLISTQNKNDLPPECINQFTHVLAYAKIPSEKRDSKLYQLFNDMSLNIPYDSFREIYLRATAPEDGETKSHNFLYVDTDNIKFRKNFDIEYKLNN